MTAATKTAAYSAALLLVCAVFILVFAYNMGVLDGHHEGYSEGLDHCEARHECHSSDRRACAFGPGIVGTQVCGWGDTWLACEPDPKCCRSTP